MKSVRSIISLQQSTSKSELLELLRALTVLKLKQRKCYENFGEHGRIIGRLVTTWKAACDVAPETCGTSAATTIDMPAFNELRSWTKDLSLRRTSPSCSCTTIWSAARRKRSITVDGGLEIAQGISVLCRWLGY